MLNDELVFKEYKAYVPPQWSEFDNSQSKIQLKKSFVQFLRAPRVENISASADDEDDDGPAKQKGKKNWMEEMSAYCKAQEIKAASKEKSMELEAELRRRKKIAADRHEQTLSNVAGNDRQNKKLLLTALEAASAVQIRTNCQRFTDQLAKKEDAVAKHLTLISERNKQVEMSRQEKSQAIAETVQSALQKAEKNRDRIFEQELRNIQASHNKELNRTLESEKRLLQQQEAEHAAQQEARKRVEARCATAIAKAEAKRQNFEAELQEKFERTSTRLSTQERIHQVSPEKEDHFQKGMHRREKLRQSQLQSCEEAEKQRRRRLDELQRHREEELNERIERARERDHKIERAVETATEKRLRKAQELLEKTHLSSGSNSSQQLPLEKSQVAEEVAEHLARKLQLDESKQQAAFEQEAKSFEREEQVLAFERLQQSRRYAAAAKHAEELRRHAESAAFIKTKTSENILAAHLEKEARSRKHFEAHQGETKESMLAAAEAQAAKILAALELTRVKQHQELMKSVEAKQLRQQEKEKIAAARHEMKMKQKQEERQLHDEQKRQYIEETNREREYRLLNSVNEKRMRVEAALRAREDLLREKQERLAEMSKETEERLKSDAAARSAELDRKRLALAAKEEARSRSISQMKEARQEMIEETAAEIQGRIFQVQARAASQQEARTYATVEKLVHVYEVGKDRVKHVSYTPIRARTASPN